MTSPLRFPGRLACFVLVLIVREAAGWQSAQTESPAKPPPSAFAQSNLHAWAYEEYDAVSRTPAERAKLLKALGLTRAGYVGRNVERMQEFEAYVTAYGEHQIELVAVWTPVNTDTPLDEPHIRMLLDSLDRHPIRPQWWVTLEQFAGAPDEQAIERAAALLRPLVAEAAKRDVPLAVYGHGRDSWFTQPENEIAIVERLRAAENASSVGIAYNFHHAHSQLERFSEVFPKLAPYLIAVNLNGMKPDGPQIVLINEGTREQEMIAAIHRSSYRGLVGVLHHQPKLDAATVLRKNIEGVRDIMKAVGDSANRVARPE
ncbi:MAG: sugar phosphate isomerase/epimerase family protein [Planctomycetaceae bacterium]